MQQLLLHSLLETQTAWQELSSETQTEPSAPMPGPLWQHWLVAEHPPPGDTHDPPLLLPDPLLLPVPPLLLPLPLPPPLLPPLHGLLRGVHDDGSGLLKLPHLVSAASFGQSNDALLISQQYDDVLLPLLVPRPPPLLPPLLPPPPPVVLAVHAVAAAAIKTPQTLLLKSFIEASERALPTRARLRTRSRHSYNRP